MGRAIGSLNIRMGIFNIPLTVHSLIDYQGVSFKQLCPYCFEKGKTTRINQIRKCLVCNKEIPYSELKWGYKLSKDKIIPIPKEMLENLSKGETRILMSYDSNSNLSAFEELIQAKVYLLTPNENVTKPYYLLRELLLKKKKSLLVQYSLKSRLHLGIIKIKTLTDRYGQKRIFLLLKQVVYSDKIKPIKPLPIEEVTEEELKLGIELFELVEQKSEKTDYTKVKDRRKELLEKILKGEVKVETVEVVKEKELVEQLKSSVEVVKKKKKKKVAKDVS